MAEKEGRGQIKINFEPYEVLKNLNDIGPEVARQICRARRITLNKVTKDNWEFYDIWDKKNIVRHFDFTPNPDEKQLEPAEFNYTKSKEKSRQNSQVHEGNQAEIGEIVTTKKANQKQDHKQESSSQKRGRTPNIPKQISFDGSENFETFRNKFRNFVDFNLFDDNTALFCLGMALTGSASRFYEHSKQHGGVNTLTEALNLLKRRFGNNQGDYANMIAFQNARQKREESDVEFAERLSELVHHAYPEGEWDQMEKEVAMKFMAGLWEPKARAFLTKYSTKATMEEMVDKLQRFRTSKLVKAERGTDKNFEVRRTGTEESSENEEDEAWEDSRGGKIERNDRTNVDEMSHRVENLEQKVKKMEDKMDTYTEGLSEMMKKMQSQLDRMEKNFSKEGGERSRLKSSTDGPHLNWKESS